MSTTEIARFLNGRIRVEESDRGFAMVVYVPGRSPTRVGAVYTSRFRALEAARNLAMQDEDPS